VIAANVKAKNLYERIGYSLTDRLLKHTWKQERTVPFPEIPFHVVETSPWETAALPFYRKSSLKAHGFNRGMKGGVARCSLLRALGATCFVFLVI
jgi:hypothetical protein